MKNKYELSDFFTRTKNENASKMELLLGEEKTGHYLMVKGGEAKSIQRDKIVAQVGYADTEEKIKTIKDKIERETMKRDLNEQVEINYALALIDDWSFGKFDLDQLKTLLEENRGLALSVIGFSATNDNYLEKK